MTLKTCDNAGFFSENAREMGIPANVQEFLAFLTEIREKGENTCRNAGIHGKRLF
ncbi:hypothetical protein HQN90_14335 [Paenibacillus alba]|nr:hypothetical protein [Paenibacillus alba]